ncbi:MAG: hypothetical protein NVSMB26_09180 [Beijerinckiaceae bacterium]
MGDQAKGQADKLVEGAKDAGSGLTSAAQGAAEQITRSARSLARDGTEKLTDALGTQMSAGADFVEEAVDSLRSAATELEDALPPVAFLLRSVAGRGGDIAEQIRTKSLGELIEVGSDYARRNPLLVFGAAAGLGLLLSRFAKSTGEMSGTRAPSRPRQMPTSSGMPSRGPGAGASRVTNL